MSHEPALQNPYASLGPAEVIGLFLARLFAHLMRLETSGETFVRPDIANMVASAEGLVQAYVRMRASAQLEYAGFTETARAMQTPISSREPLVHREQAQVCETHSPAQLLERLQTTIDTFERAEHLASTLARVIVFALIYVCPETHSTGDYVRIHAEDKESGLDFSPLKLRPLGRGPPYIGSPPFLPRPESSLERALCEPQARESK